MSLSDLANVMLRAGVEEGMELDYGLDWVQLSTYTGVPGTAIDGEQRTEPAVVDARRTGSLLRVVLGNTTSSRCRCGQRTSTHGVDEDHVDDHDHDARVSGRRPFAKSAWGRWRNIAKA